jgi:hypothetical protein
MPGKLIWTVCLSALLLQACGNVTHNSVSEVRNGDYKVMIRSYEYNHSGTYNVDICAAKATAGPQLPKAKLQCFLEGSDFDNLSVSWKSKRLIEVSFHCGSVSQFGNFAFVYPKGPVPDDFYIMLRDSCGTPGPGLHSTDVP